MKYSIILGTLRNQVICIPNSVLKTGRYALDTYLSVIQIFPINRLYYPLQSYGHCENPLVSVLKQSEATVMLNEAEGLSNLFLYRDSK